MAIQSPQNAVSSVISVTTTATSLFDLINTAGSTNIARAGYTSGVNMMVINCEDGDIRILRGATPTTTKGKILKQGTHIITETTLDDILLISTSGTVSCSLLIGTI